MATFIGKNGVVKIGDYAVGEIRSYTVRKSVELEEDTYIGLTAKTFFSTKESWSGSLEVYLDELDTGQNALPIGAEISIAFYPNWPQADKYVGNAIVTKRQVLSSFDGMIEASFDVLGKSPLIFSSDTNVNNLETEDNFNLLQEDSSLILLES